MKVRHSLFLSALLAPLHAQEAPSDQTRALLGVLAPQQGQEVPPQTLSPLVVTATRSPGEAADLPYTVNYLDSDFLLNQQRRTVPESLQYTPGVLVQKTAHGHGSPYIRGFTGRQNLLLMDGVRMNNSTFRSGPVQYWGTVDPLSIDHMELVMSQGSVLYGSDAIGGTLNAFGKQSDFRNRTAGEAFYGGLASYEYRSNGEGSHIGRVEMQTGLGGVFGVMAGVSVKDFGDIRGHRVGRMRHTGYDEQGYDLRLDYAPTPDSTLTLASYYVNQDDIWRWHRTKYNPGWTHGGHTAVPGSWNSDIYDQERSLTYLRYAGVNPREDAFISRWTATLSYQKVDDSEFMDRLSGSRPLRANSVNVETFGADIELESKIGPGELVYGLDFYHDWVHASGYQKNADGSGWRESLPVSDGSTYSTLGAYSQYTWHASDRLDVTGGLRYTYVDADLGRYYDSDGLMQRGGTKDWDAVVGSLRGIYRLDGGWSLYGGISQAFRAPNLDDLTGNMTAKSGIQSTGNANVGAEKFITYELGTRYLREDASFGATVFYTDGDDMIASANLPGGGTTTTNANKGYAFGFELDGSWRFHPQWEVSGFMAWHESRVEAPLFVGGSAVRKPNSRQLPLTGSLALRWTHPSIPLWVEGRVLAAGKEDRITAADQASDNQRIPTNGTPGYLVSSLRAGYLLNENVEFNLGLENLTNEDYRNHGSGQNEPGFGVVAGMKFRW